MSLFILKSLEETHPDNSKFSWGVTPWEWKRLPIVSSGRGCSYTRKEHLHLEVPWSEVKWKSLSCVRLFAAPWTVARQAPPSMEFSRQEYWSGLPLPSPGDPPNPGIEHGISQARILEWGTISFSLEIPWGLSNSGLDPGIPVYLILFTLSTVGVSYTPMAVLLVSMSWDMCLILASMVPRMTGLPEGFSIDVSLVKASSWF